MGFNNRLKHIFKSTSFWKDNSLIIRELRHFPLIVSLTLIFTVLAAVLEGFGIGFLLGFLQNLVDPNGKPFEVGIDWFDEIILGVSRPEMERLYRISVLILVITWFRSFSRYAASVHLGLAQVNLTSRLQKKIFEQLQSLSLTYYSKVRPGTIISTLNSEVMQLQQAIDTYGFLLSKGLVLIVYAGIAVSISWQLSAIAIIAFSSVGLSVSQINKKVREFSFPVSDARKSFTSIAIEFVNSIRTVKAFATQDFERNQFYSASENLANTSIRSTKRMALVRPLVEGLATTVMVAMIILGLTLFVENGQIQVASLLTFLFVLFRLVPALQELSGSFARISQFQGSMSSVEELLRTDDKPYITNGYRQFNGLHRAIEFVAVTFGYDSKNLVLQDITLTIEKGKTIALVGASGAGKSTLADLIPRFYDPTEGKVLYDGIDLRELNTDSLRQQMAIVSQETFIFNTSVRENIAYGTEYASNKDIEDAANLANALDFIHDLPDGFDTILGDRGVCLSGGQRQRIAIARALLRDPQILILDEATSALDTVSERLIQQSIEKLSAGRTVIAIAHRLSTIVNAEKVVVMDAGRIVEQGTYKELLSQRGKLWSYHHLQQQTA